MGWRRRTQSDDEVDPLPADISPAQAAEQAVAAFLLVEPSDPSAVVERIEVVELQSGQWPVTTAIGVLLEWRQGIAPFGLLMPIERLAHQAGGLDGVAFYLRLAVDEPHSDGPGGTRRWFTDLPSGPY